MVYNTVCEEAEEAEEEKWRSKETMPVKCLETIIGSGLFQYVSESDTIDVYEHLNITERSCRKGEYICYQGDKIDSILIVKRGSVRTEKTYPNGDLHIMSLFEDNSIVALEVAVSRQKTVPFDIIANEKCEIVFISMQSIEGSACSHQLRQAMIEMLADDNIRMSHKIEILAERGLRDRVMVYLNVLAKKSGSNTVQVKMSREQMAQFLCVNRSALSNELNKMKREGIIDFHRGQFRILTRNTSDKH